MEQRKQLDNRDCMLSIFQIKPEPISKVAQRFQFRISKTDAFSVREPAEAICSRCCYPNSHAKSMRAAVVPTLAAERRQQPTTPVQKATKMKKKATMKRAIIERAMSAGRGERSDDTGTNRGSCLQGTVRISDETETDGVSCL